MESHVKFKIGLIFLISILFAGCSKPLPQDKLTYAGHWHSSEMQLLILVDGTLDYKRQKNGGGISINAPISKFEGNNFVVGVWPFLTRFEVSEPPNEVNGNWQMVVDGVLLTKTSE
jgi:hypothetical protein